MRYLALACDYDGTLASDGRVSNAALTALQHFRASGRKVILVTGRQLEELISVFPELDLCDWVVAENGALLYQPSSHAETRLADPPSAQFIRELTARAVPISVGRVIVATWHPHETTVLATIRDLGLDSQVIFNKGAVMVLPSGINKATGLLRALSELELTSHNVVGIGDAENDHAFLRLCECSAAVANALPTVKESVDLVTTGDHGAGVVEVIDALINGDLRDADPRLTRHHILLGKQENGADLTMSPYGPNVLLAGTSGRGKSTLATGILERLAEHRYQCCIIDPEGDYEHFQPAVALGNSQRAPSVEEALQVLKNPTANAVVNLVGLPLQDRPGFFLTLLLRLQELRARTGRPHWLVLDEAHHLLPANWGPASLALPQELAQTLFITVHPNQLALPAVTSVETVIAIGDNPETTLREAGELLHRKPPTPSFPLGPLQTGEALFWSLTDAGPLRRFRTALSQTEGLRHRRKYAEGDLGETRSFYFRGPEHRLNLRAQNLLLFTQLAEGVDDQTWTYHLRRHDYSRWFREAIKDEILAEEASGIENRDELLPEESRTRMKEAVTRLYTLPTTVSAAVSSETSPEIRSPPKINTVKSTKVSSPERGRSRKL